MSIFARILIANDLNGFFCAKVGLMDLAAFLAPGVYPVFKVGNSLKGEPWGHVLRRPGGRVSWLARDPATSGDRLTLALKVPGYSLDNDGSLLAALDAGPGAWVILSGEVKDCRFFKDSYYLLRLTGLVRILD